MNTRVYCLKGVQIVLYNIIWFLIISYIFSVLDRIIIKLLWSLKYYSELTVVFIGNNYVI